MQIDKMPQQNQYKTWIYNQIKLRSDQINSKLTELQHPPNCKSADKIVCRTNVMCGLGCQLHFLAYCQLKAYYTNKTFIYTVPPTNITGFKSLNSIIHQTTDCSSDETLESKGNLTANLSRILFVFLKLICIKKWRGIDC